MNPTLNVSIKILFHKLYFSLQFDFIGILIPKIIDMGAFNI